MSLSSNFLKSIKDFFGPVKDTDYIEIAKNELAVARIKLMEAQQGRDYAEAMIGYHTATVDRLINLLQKGYTPVVSSQQLSSEVTDMKK